jgi:hypothetical protein
MTQRFPQTYPNGFDLTLRRHALELPLRWRAPRVVFVNSMSDLFHADVPEAYIAEVFSVMERCPQHTFQVLTKRADMKFRLQQASRADQRRAAETTGLLVVASCQYPLQSACCLRESRGSVEPEAEGPRAAAARFEPAWSAGNCRLVSSCSPHQNLVNDKDDAGQR